MIDFCLQELEALIGIFGLNLTRKELYVEDWETLKIRNMVDDPTVYIKLPKSDSERLCKEIVGRSIMIKEIIDVFSEAWIETQP